jgi:glycerophosphoryl diester phosphodiesterase
MFLNLAHRGASAYAPENTLSAFYKAIGMAPSGIETDLQMTKDGVLVLFHDNKLDRTTNGTGHIGEYDWAELKELDAGSWFSESFKGEKLVKLEQFLYFFGSKNLQFALELKAPNIEAETLRLIKKYNIQSKVTITSFQLEYLARVRSLNSEIKLGYLVHKLDEHAIGQVQSVQAAQICPSAKNLLKEEVDLAKAHGLQVRAWGVHNEALMHHILDCCCHGATVNFPDLLAQELELRGGK